MGTCFFSNTLKLRCDHSQKVEAQKKSEAHPNDQRPGDQNKRHTQSNDPRPGEQHKRHTHKHKLILRLAKQ